MMMKRRRSATRTERVRTLVCWCTGPRTRCWGNPRPLCRCWLRRRRGSAGRLTRRSCSASGCRARLPRTGLCRSRLRKYTPASPSCQESAWKPTQAWICTESGDPWRRTGLFCAACSWICRSSWPVWSRQWRSCSR